MYARFHVGYMANSGFNFEKWNMLVGSIHHIDNHV